MKLSVITTISESKVNELNRSLSGYWENDIWDTNDPIFNNFRKTDWGKTHRTMNFSYFSPMLKNEVKFFIMNRVQKGELQLASAVHNYGGSFKRLADFLARHIPNLRSFADLEINKALMQLRSYLSENGLSIRTHRKRKLSNYENLLNRLYLFYQNYYDTRTEFEKEVWDVRNIPGARYSDHESRQILNFKAIPKPFQDLAKRYLKFRISRLSTGQCCLDLMAIKLFLIFLHRRHPAWNTLKDLARADIEEFLVWHNQELKDKVPTQRAHIIALKVFLETLERLQYVHAPKLTTNLLFFNEDIPRYRDRTENDIKYIPEGVIQQIEERLEHLKPPKFIPVIILLRATGWRISDILNLKYDNCLDYTSQGWYLSGDITKMQVLNHRVPITDEVAAVVETVIEIVKDLSHEVTIQRNTYLFSSKVYEKVGHLITMTYEEA